ncbi:MAG: PPC domain-containing protein [Myxococcales bacterium]|nr:PPC domain-containing protein [Myxococcales bacterium]
MKLRSAWKAWMLGACVAASAGAVGCEPEETEEEQDFTSREATLMTFTFDGELVTTETFDLKQTINDQLLYTIGHLNGDRSVGRLDTVQLTDIKTERQDDGTTKVTYHAVMAVGWGSKTKLPSKYTFKMPRQVDFSGLEAFSTKYGHDCVESGAHDVSSGNLWYYYRPNRSSCSLAEGDFVTFEATAEKSAENTEGKYPEYHKVWEDNELRVVAIFGKYEDGATTTSDAGISAYNSFVSSVRKTWKDGAVVPSDAPTSPGVKVPDIEMSATLPGGRKIVVNALLVDNVASAPQTFYTRYEGLSTSADIIFYNGHAGLGQNVRALAKRGKFEAGKYQLFFMNGCDTFAYVDGSLAKTRSTLNPDDPTGTKYMDMVTNVMPSFFSSMPNASMALIKGLTKVDAPLTYQEIFADIDRSQVVVVTGEEDNVFAPGGVEQPWELNEAGTVAKNQEKQYTLGTLQPGSYVIGLHEDQATPGGDADLYVRFGSAPTKTSYDFRPWLDGSNEEVRFTLDAPTQVFVMVHGYEGMAEASAAYKLSGRTE